MTKQDVKNQNKKTLEELLISYLEDIFVIEKEVEEAIKNQE